MPEHDYMQTARDFLAHGFSVIPIQLDGTKQPVGSWGPYAERFPSDHELQQWFATGAAGIGVVCGSISDNLLVIDFDHEADELFPRFWTAAQQALPGIVSRLLVVQTPRPGRQVWLRMTSTPPSSVGLAWTEPQTVKQDGPAQPRVLIETRGSRSYVVAPGSPLAVHPTGRPYAIIHGTLQQLEPMDDKAAATLLDICRGFTRWKPQNVQRQPGERYLGEPRPGDVFNEQTDLRQMLVAAGWQHHHTDAEGVEYLIRPGKDTPGFSASLGYVRTDDGRPLLYVFSGNAAPFEAGNCYDPFAVFALLHHGGDFGTAAAAVRIRYAQQVANAQQAFHAAVAEQVLDPPAFEPFPTDCLPPTVQSYVCEHSTAIGIDAAFVGVPILSTLAGLIGSARSLYLKRSYDLPAIIWTATVADVSSGKTPGWSAATAPAERIERAIHQAAARLDAEYEKQLAAFTEAAAAGGAAGPKPQRPKHVRQFVVVDFTMESLVDIHRNNSKLLLSCDELAGWVRRMDQYRPGADVENWLSIYNGGPMSVNRCKGDGYRVWLPRTSISVTGTIQPAVADELLYSPRFVGNGLAARVLAAKPPSSIVRWSDSEPDERVDLAMDQLAERLYQLTGEPHGSGERPQMLPCSPEARQAFIQWTNDAADHAEQLDPALRSGWLKLRPAAGRFALVFAICKQLEHHPEGQAAQPVDLESMQAGIRLAWWFGSELERNAAANEQTTLQEHLRWILKHHPSGLDVRTLQAGRRSIGTADQARSVMQQLVERNWGRLDGTLFVPMAPAA
jgi:hypothetical protein